MKFKIIFAVLALVCSTSYADGMGTQKPADLDLKSQPAWPLVGSDADYSSYQSSTLKFNDSSTVDLMDMNAPSTNGWSGGASLTPPDMSLGDDCNECAMTLSNKNLIKNFGYQTLSGSTPAPLPITEDLSSSINEYGVSTIEGTTEYVPDMVREFVAKEGKTMREVLEEWAILEGWEVVWTTTKEYPLQASAIFKGRFTDVASALTRSFGRASPPPYAKFYFGNKVLVIKTLEDENAD